MCVCVFACEIAVKPIALNMFKNKASEITLPAYLATPTWYIIQNPWIIPFTFLLQQTSKQGCEKRRHGPAGKIQSLARVVVGPFAVLRKHPAVSQLAAEHLIRRVLIVFHSVVSSASSCHQTIGLALIRTSVGESPYVSQLERSVPKWCCILTPTY